MTYFTKPKGAPATGPPEGPVAADPRPWAVLKGLHHSLVGQGAQGAEGPWRVSGFYTKE